MKNLGVLIAAALIALPFGAMAQEVPASCSTPGEKVSEDTVGDGNISPVTTASIPSPVPGDDIEWLAVSEPASLSNRLVLTLKVTTLSPLAPQTRWLVYFSISDAEGNYTDWYAGMSTASLGGQQTPEFEYGTIGSISTPAADIGAYTKVGDLDPASNYADDGTITLVVDTAAIGIGPGTDLENLIPKVRRSTPPETQNIGLTNDDAPAGFYTMMGNAACADAKAAAGSSGSGALGGAFGPAALFLLMLGGALRRRAR